MRYYTRTMNAPHTLSYQPADKPPARATRRLGRFALVAEVHLTAALVTALLLIALPVALMVGVPLVMGILAMFEGNEPIAMIIILLAISWTVGIPATISTGAVVTAVVIAVGISVDAVRRALRLPLWSPLLAMPPVLAVLAAGIVLFNGDVPWSKPGLQTTAATSSVLTALFLVYWLALMGKDYFWQAVRWAWHRRRTRQAAPAPQSASDTPEGPP